MNYIIKGLHCADCASKIEHKLKKLQGVSDVQINIATETLKIISDNNITKSQIENIINQVEQGVTIYEKGEDIKIFNINKIELFRFVVACLIFVVGLLNPPNIYIFLLAYLIAGYDILLLAFRNILKGEIFDENFLMGIASIGAFFIGEFGEGVAVILFYKAGEILQDMAVDKSKNSIKALMDIRADYANLVTDNNKTTKVSPETIKINDIILIKPGEKVPLDGIIIEGTSLVDTKALTGESVPREVFEGFDVLSGSINLNGLLKVQVKKLFTESTASKILELVTEAASKKSKTENLITKFARYYTPIVVLLAVLIGLFYPIVTNGNFFDGVHKALVFLVISCPCALVISIPLSFFGSIGAFSKNGILVKGSNYIEALNQTSKIVFDKTGTITKGNFKVSEICSEILEEEILKFAAYVEYYSDHPIAKSIKEAYNQEIIVSNIKDYKEYAGLGVSAKIFDKNVLAGNQKLMDNNNIKTIKNIGTTLYVAIDNKLAGYIIISDELKEDSIDTIKALKQMGINELAMLSGDKKEVCQDVCDKIGVDEYYYDLLPEQKLSILENMLENMLSKQKGKLIYIGDGINDAPVLSRADIGIAMGGLGSDAAIEAADIVIMDDAPSKIITALNIAKKTKIIIMQNITFIFLIKVIILMLGVFTNISMWLAVFADVGVAILAILNSIRILKEK